MKTGKALLSFILLSSFAPQVIAAPAKKTLEVGIVMRLEDKFNDTVAELMNGIETAQVLYQEMHPRTKIKLVKFKHKDELASVLAATESAIKAKMPAVIGGELSEESLVIGEKLGEKKIVFITPTSSNPDVTEGRPFAFRSCFSDKSVATQIANFVADHQKDVKAVGILHNISSPYTDYLSKQFAKAFADRMAGRPKKDQIPVYVERVIKDTPDYEPQIERFMNKGVTHVIMLAHQSTLLRFVLQASNKGYFPTYFGSDGWGSNEHLYKNLVVEAPNGKKFKGYRNSYWKEDSQSPMVTSFKNTFVRMNKRNPNAWSAIAFDAAWVLFLAMDRAKDPRSGESIREQMVKIKNEHLVTADQFTFGPDNSPEKDLYIYRIDGSGINYEMVLR